MECEDVASKMHRRYFKTIWTQVGLNNIYTCDQYHCKSLVSLVLHDVFLTLCPSTADSLIIHSFLSVIFINKYSTSGRSSWNLYILYSCQAVCREEERNMLMLCYHSLLKKKKKEEEHLGKWKQKQKLTFCFCCVIWWSQFSWKINESTSESMRQRPLGLEHGSMNYIPLMMSHAFMILSIIKNRKEVVDM